MRISTTTLANLMSMMAATVSSSARSSVGPKQTPRFETVIMFRLQFAATWVKMGKKLALGLQFSNKDSGTECE